MSPTTGDAIVVANVSKWYDRVLGVSDVNWRMSSGIVGLLGPNGAGKSTLIKMLAGLARPSRGALEVFSGSPFLDLDVRRRIGYAPEHDHTWQDMQIGDLVTRLAELAGVPRRRSRDAAMVALEQVGMQDAVDRKIRGLSKGMRQRTKLATAIAHDPDLLLLDEPLSGVDPVARIEIVARIRELAARGKTICVSSHVLYEIEALTTRIAVLDRGRMVADGDIGEIRRRLHHRPHRVRVACDRPRTLAAALVAHDHVARVEVTADTAIVETRQLDQCYDDIAAAIRADRLVVSSMSALDTDLGAVLDLLSQAGGK
ncbi:MAG TPA: ABC transporter ATP-binding protein [Kofleriaceae bacterium]